MARTATGKDPAGVADRLHSAAIHVLRGVRKADARTGVSPARLSALSVLVFGGPMRMTDLARAEQVSVPTMSRLVAALESGGLVRRRDVSGDARASTLEATARGVKVMQDGRRRRVERLATALARLSASELAVLERGAALMENVATTI